MSGRARQCRRLVQVRAIQHNIALLAAEQALGRVAALEASAVRIEQVRLSFGAPEGRSTGAALARSGEMAMRLDIARTDLERSLEGARHHAAASGEARLEARRKKDSMTKLSERAAAEAQRREASKQQRVPAVRRKAGDQDYR